MSPADYKATREKLGLTQARLAARLGLPRTAIVKREAGDQRITEEAALALRALKPSKTKKAPGGSNDGYEPHEGSPPAPKN